jgi:LysR family transcriptional regulator, hypochlorite-specific transcription factor HypT
MGPGNRPLDMEWLEDFVALAETGSFSRAAEVRAIAQPAFSRHIRALEDWVGVELFDRSTHPTELTAGGQKFRPLLLQVLADLEAARIKARIAHTQEVASLRFAATHMLSLMFFPQWLVNLESSMDIGSIQMMSDSFQACESLMMQRRVQFLLCHRHAQSASRMDEMEFPMIGLGADALIPVSAPAPDDASRPAHSVDGAAPMPLLAYDPASALSRIVQHKLKQSPQLSIRQTFVAPHAVLLRSMALQGRGIAWLPTQLAQDELAQGRLLRAGGPDWDIPVEICLYRQPNEMSPVAEQLWRVLTGA